MNGFELILNVNTMSWLLNGRYTKEFSRLFECPLPFYVLDLFVLIEDRARLVHAIDCYLDRLFREGVVKVEPGHVQIEDSSNARCLAVVRWDHLLDDGSIHSSSTVRYVFRRGSCSGRARIELVEYLDAAFPELSETLGIAVET